MTEHLDIAIQAAKEAGAFLREHFENTESLVVNEASQHDIKLELDVRSQTLITERLLGAFPDHALRRRRHCRKSRQSLAMDRRSHRRHGELLLWPASLLCFYRPPS